MLWHLLLYRQTCVNKRGEDRMFLFEMWWWCGWGGEELTKQWLCITTLPHCHTAFLQQLYYALVLNTCYINNLVGLQGFIFRYNLRQSVEFVWCCIKCGLHMAIAVLQQLWKATMMLCWSCQETTLSAWSAAAFLDIFQDQMKHSIEMKRNSASNYFTNSHWLYTIYNRLVNYRNFIIKKLENNHRIGLFTLSLRKPAHNCFL